MTQPAPARAPVMTREVAHGPAYNRALQAPFAETCAGLNKRPAAATAKPPEA